MMVCGVLPREGGRPARHPLCCKGVDTESTPLTPSAGARFVPVFMRMAPSISPERFAVYAWRVVLVVVPSCLSPGARARFVVRFGLAAHNSSLKCF